ncbi:MAG: ABC transporter substrate-binding protein [Chromatiales bacterium]|jgi:phospholipid transport system substrate-binding protein
MRHPVKASAIAVLLLLTALPRAWGATGPVDLVRGTADRVLEQIAHRKAELEADPSGIYELVKDEVVPHFDFERMAQWVLGRYWNEASEQQRSRFVVEFREMLVRTYAKVLLEYSGQQIAYPPMRVPEGAREVKVRTEVLEAGAPPVPVDYSLYYDGRRWRVFDVVVDGVSLVSNYRSSFSREIRRAGIDSLIRKLEQRNRGGAA